MQGFKHNDTITAGAGHALKASLLQFYNQNATQTVSVLESLELHQTGFHPFSINGDQMMHGQMGEP